jgi:ribosomal-protein-alanine N-acetyltransferase
MTMKTCKLRFLRPSDWPEVMDIENQSFDYPWREIEFRRTIRSPGVTCLVAEMEFDVAGYVVYERLERNVVLMNLAIHPKYQRSGIGKALISDLKSRTRGNVKRILTDVSEYNDNAHLFFKSQGFLCTEILADYYDDDDDYPAQDAYRFVWEAA